MWSVALPGKKIGVSGKENSELQQQRKKKKHPDLLQIACSFRQSLPTTRSVAGLWCSRQSRVTQRARMTSPDAGHLYAMFRSRDLT
ncbi:hypothetical protein ElyMa_003064300 [Elysia marginata]|uniref:Uncharacterized protein n=1 Tax=Elysia marginata TaxID=1093978 RepID=A0AAV4IJ99_9GAST|nr:hypothetical protein ElyMa_003064300 [Elysia marginata]